MTPDFIKLLAPDIRWQIVQALATSDRRVGELVSLLGQPKNLLSYHLKQLRTEFVISYRRSDADRRDYYYSLNVPRLHELYQQAGAALNFAPAAIAPPDAPPTRILILCTGNSARSQMAEALLRARGGDHVVVYSAGSNPSAVHPLAIQVMDEIGIDIRHHASQHFDDFAAHEFDYVITVCDRVREVCPTYPGVHEIHWSFANPAEADDPLLAFRETAQGLALRIPHLLNLIWSERQ